MTPDEKKQLAAKAALEYVQAGTVIGIGTGSTANHFIDMLADIKHKIDGTVASSEASADRLRKHGIQVLDLNAVDDIAVYVDGADESTRHLQLIKGGGGALTREKIVAAVAKKFVCIADESKLVDVLGKFPLPVEVIPMARGHVARELTKLGGNGNVILDVHNLEILEPSKLETEINQITGVVTNGLFARRPADALILGTDEGAKILQ